MKPAALVALLLCVSAGRIAAQSVVRGTVISTLDHAPIASADISTVDGRARVRADAQGRFHIAIGPGDSIRVRAVGFVERRIAWRGADSVVALDPFATILATVTTTAGQRTIRINESTASNTVVERADVDAAAASAVNQVLRQIPGFTGDVVAAVEIHDRHSRTRRRAYWCSWMVSRCRAR